MKWQPFIQDLSVLDVSKLERRWLKYKIKKVLPYGLLITATLILGLIIPWLVLDKPSAVSSTPPKKESIKPKASLAIASEHNEDTMILEPSMDFIQSMNSPSIPTAVISAAVAPIASPTKSTLVPNPIPPPLATPAKEPLSKTQPQPIPKATQPVLKGKLSSIKRDDAAFDIHEIEERFKENSNPNLGLYIARYHYDHGNYSEAYNYALKTNAINNTMDDSWLIFAKSLVKLGKVDQAKKTLQLYISNSNSESAKNLLDTLNKESSK